MTLNDDRLFLLHHLRSSFVVSDDTGLCEMVVEPDIILENKIRGSISSEADLELYSQSPDIVSDAEFGSTRLRSSTVLRLQKLKEEKQTKAKVKSIRIVDSSVGMSSVPASSDSSEDIFLKKQISSLAAVDPEQKKKSSLLSKLVSDVTSVSSENPFNEYAKFDGKATYGVQTQAIDVFLPFLSSKSDRNYPLPVVVVSAAKVRELIGLVCWQYTAEHRLPLLSAADVEEFRLHLVEDDGEVDTDFPPLDGREPISKFGFSRLALVPRRPLRLSTVVPAGGASKETDTAAQRQEPSVAVAVRAATTSTTAGQQQPSTYGIQNSVLVTVYDADQCSTKLRCESEYVTLQDIVGRVLAKRGISSQDYRLEKLSEPGLALNLDMTLAMAAVRDFRIMRINRGPPSVRPTLQKVTAPAVNRPKSDLSAASERVNNPEAKRPLSLQVGATSTVTVSPGGSAAAQGQTSGQRLPEMPSSAVRTASAVSRRLNFDYKSYSVSMVQKLFFTKYDVQLGISAERIEIHPMSHKSALKLLFRQKAVTIDTACLADCQMLDEKQAGRTQFKLTFLCGTEFRQYDFEADQAMAREIVQAIRDIMDIRGDLQEVKDSPAASKKSPSSSRRMTHFV